MEEKSAQPETPKARFIPVNVAGANSDKSHQPHGAAPAHPQHHKAVPFDSKKTFVDYVPPTMEDPQLDKVIDDIIVSESNEVLAAEDSMYGAAAEVVKPKKKSKLAKIFKSKWLYIALAVIIVGLFVWPTSRYLILGKFVKNNYKLTVIDSVTDKPVSGAVVFINKSSYTTDASGRTDFKLPVGKHTYRLSKQYYANTSGSIFVGLSKKEDRTIQLLATGRQVPITIINKISDRPLAGVKISILNTSAVTNSVGQAQIVLPTKKSSYEATISANSFDTVTTPVQVTTSSKVNVISLVPAGNIYYLSNSTGSVDVIKANLDGSNPTIELAGTDSETTSTQLLPSPDWKYLVLEAQRSGSQPELYVINTATGNLDEFESAADSFNLIGWSGDDFLYDEIAGSEDTSTVGREQIKSYDATNGQLNIIDENQVVGSSPSYGYQSFGDFELLPNLLVYTTSWTSVGGYDISSQNDTIRGVEPSGLNKKDYSSFVSSNTGSMTIVRNQPQSLYIAVNDNATNQTSFFTFASGAVNSASISSATFSAAYPTYYLSPSGVQTLWSTTQNNQTQIFIGNQSGQDGKRLIVPSGFNVYGWYDNIYVLLSKNNQLYIAPSSGTNTPTLIGSYLNPS